MPTTCTASGTIAVGDAVCVIAWDGGANRPTVARATAANLGTSKTVYGVTKVVSGGGTPVDVLVAGEAFDAGLFPGGSPMLSGTGAGSSHVVATDITQGSAANQCKLVRVERPNGSEHIVGTCDENGNIIVQPRASRDTSPQHVFNVCSYGAVGDGRTLTDAAILSGTRSVTTSSAQASDLLKQILIVGAAAGGGDLISTVTAVGVGSLTLDPGQPAAALTVTGAPAVVWLTDNQPKIQSALDAMPSGGGVLFLPASDQAYVIADDLAIPENVSIQFDQGAVIMPAAKTLTINGPIVAAPTQTIFGGIGHGTNAAVHPNSSGAPLITASGSSLLGCFSIAVRITTDGNVPTAEFEWSSDGGLNWTGPVPTAASYTLPGLGITLGFPGGTYVAYPDPTYDLYGWSSTPAIVLLGRARTSVIHAAWWGPPLDEVHDDAFAIQAALDSVPAFSSATVVLPPTPLGAQAPLFLRSVRVRRGHIIQGAAGTQSDNGTVIYCNRVSATDLS